jgi:hypothetical protein
MTTVLTPSALTVLFTATITGLFNLSDVFPVPVAVAAGAGWGVVVALGATWLNSKPLAAAWVEDSLVFVGIFALAFAGCGGVMALLMLNGALDSSSLTGETLESTFLPMIPYYIAANAPLELVIMPALLCLGWRPGKRRALIMTGVAMYFALRVWTYLAYRPARLGFAESDRTGAPMTAAERHQAYLDLKVDDPRWILVLTILAVFIAAASFPRLREVKTPAAARTA